jgi:hypothetical protein
MMLRIALLTAVLAFGCSSSQTQTPFDDGTAAAAVNKSTERLAYPAAPYGATQGATIENFGFLGWNDATSVGFDQSALTPIELADFYDPAAAKGIRYLVITSTALWCSACKLEYKDFASGNVATYENKGVRFLGALFEDNDSNPAQPSDLAIWAKQFQVSFPFGLDPELKLGAFFDVEATPMEMIVDTKTMKIVTIDEGWATSGSSTLWASLDQLLAQ